MGYDFLVGLQHETVLLEDSLVLPGFPPMSSKFVSSEEEFVDSDDFENSRPRTRPSAIPNPPLADPNLIMVPTGTMKQEFRRRHAPQGWLHKMVLCCSFSDCFSLIPLPFLFPNSSVS